MKIKWIFVHGRFLITFLKLKCWVRFVFFLFGVLIFPTVFELITPLTVLFKPAVISKVCQFHSQCLSSICFPSQREIIIIISSPSIIFIPVACNRCLFFFYGSLSVKRQIHYYMVSVCESEFHNEWHGVSLSLFPPFMWLETEKYVAVNPDMS